MSRMHLSEAGNYSQRRTQAYIRGCFCFAVLFLGELELQAFQPEKEFALSGDNNRNSVYAKTLAASLLQFGLIYNH